MITPETYEAYQQAMLYFLTQDPFHGYILSEMQLEEVDERTPEAIMPVAGVSVVGTRIYLYLRKGVFSALPPRQRVFLLRHEVMHVIDLHFARMLQRGPELWNIAADLAINSLIDHVPGSEMPSWALHPQTVGPKLGIQLPMMQNAETYYTLLKQKARTVSVQLNDDGSIGVKTDDSNQRTGGIGRDIHPYWKDAAAQSPSLNDAAVRRVVGQAYKQFGSKLAGMYPAEYVRSIRELLEPEIDWRRYASLFVGSVLSNLRRRTWMRPNRREIPFLRGEKRTLTARIVVGLDTSGSVTDDDLTRFVSELRSIVRSYSAEIYAVPCDAVAYDPVPVKRTTDINRLIRQLKGGGGTLFGPVIEKAKELQADGIIYFTDGYNSDQLPEQEPVRTLWVLTKDGSEPVAWGQKTRFKGGQAA